MTVTYQPPEPPVTGVARAIAFLETYDGGPCFFVHPLSASEKTMSVEGYGRSVEAFRQLDAAFREANGYEAEIGMRQIGEKQCPLAEFLRRVDRGTASTPELTLDTDRLKSGMSLSGSLSGLGDRPVSLYLADERGYVSDLGKFLRRDGDRARFTVRVTLAERSAPPLGALSPQIVVAVSADRFEPGPPFEQFDSFLARLAAAVDDKTRAVGIDVRYYQIGQ